MEARAGSRSEVGTAHGDERPGGGEGLAPPRPVRPGDSEMAMELWPAGSTICVRKTLRAVPMEPSGCAKFSFDPLP